MSEAALDFALDDGVAMLTFNRPDAGNTLNEAMVEALLDAAIRCDNDPAIRCVVLTGRGKLFCGGGDITAFEAAGDDISAYLSRLAGKMHMAVSRLMRMQKPLVTLVNGPAAGAGLSFAICGDIVLAARSAKFQAAYAAIGLTPDGGLSWLLPRLVGMRRAQEMIVANRGVAADEAERIGLVTRLVDDDQLMADGMAQAKALAALSPVSTSGARELLLDSYGGSFEGQLERETRMIASAAASAECRAGVAAFLSRKK